MLTFEVLIGSVVLLLGTLFTLLYFDQHLSTGLVIVLSLFTLLGCILLYLLSLKPTRQLIWKQQRARLCEESILAGLTSQQIKQIYPLFLLSGEEQRWQAKLAQINPMSVNKAHLP